MAKLALDVNILILPEHAWSVHHTGLLVRANFPNGYHKGFVRLASEHLVEQVAAFRTLDVPLACLLYGLLNGLICERPQIQILWQQVRVQWYCPFSDLKAASWHLAVLGCLNRIIANDLQILKASFARCAETHAVFGDSPAIGPAKSLVDWQ